MKRTTAFLCIFILGINSFLYKYTAEAAEGVSVTSSDEAETASDVPQAESGSEVLDGPQIKGSMQILNAAEDGAGDVTVSGNTPYNGITDEEDGGLVSLLIPGKLEVILNPWELGGKPQVYSENYTVKNCGSATGFFAFTKLACEPQEEDVDVRPDNVGLHEGTEKNIWLEMELENGDLLTLTEEPVQYEILLEPGEEFAFRFSGEANENAEEEWSGGDLSVTVTYAWNPMEKDVEAEPETGDSVEAPVEETDDDDTERALLETSAKEDAATENVGGEQATETDASDETGQAETETTEQEQVTETETVGQEQNAGETDVPDETRETEAVGQE